MKAIESGGISHFFAISGFQPCPISEVFRGLEGVKKARLRAWQSKVPAPVCPAWAESSWMKGANRNR